MLLFRGAVYRPVWRRASTVTLTAEFQRILDQHAQRYNAAMQELATLDKRARYEQAQMLSYQHSKALAKDLNAAVHLEYELYANLFGVQYLTFFEHEELCTMVVETVFGDYGGQLRYCPTVSKRLWLCETCKPGWNYSAEALVNAIDKMVKKQKVKDPAAEFLSALVQHSSDLGFRAAPTFLPNKMVKIEIGGAYAELTKMGNKTVKLDYFVAYGVKGGWGSRVLGIITDLADQYCVALQLFASPMAQFEYVPDFQPRPKNQRMNLKKLMEFYHRFGFDPMYVHKWGADMARNPNCRAN